MRRLLLCLLLLLGAIAHADEATPLLIIFDASGSMNEPAGGERKIDAARKVARELIADFPGNAPLGLMLYGHRRAKDCSDIETLSPPLPPTAELRRQFSDRIAALAARGETPIAAALTAAIPLFAGRPGRVVLVTDGREECGGDPCAAAARLAAAGVALKVDIVGFRLPGAARGALACVTGQTGGRYYDADDAEALRAALRNVTEEAAPAGRLEIAVTEGGHPARNVMVTVRDEAGRIVAGLAENPSRFQLPPGRYRVTARAGSGEESPPLAVELQLKKSEQRTIEVGTGTVEVVLAAAGRPLAPVPQFQLRRDGAVIASRDHPPRSFQAQAGEYEVRVPLSSGEIATIGRVTIQAGERRSERLDTELAQLTVEVTGAGFAPGRGPWPRIELTREGRFAAAINDNPGRFLLLAGPHLLTVKDAEGKAIAERELTLPPGAAERVHLP